MKDDPVLPDNGFDGRNWRDDFQLTLHRQDEVRITRPTGNIFLTNIHRVYSGDDIPPSPDDEDMRDYFLGKRPTGATTDSKVDLGMIVRDCRGSTAQCRCRSLWQDGQITPQLFAMSAENGEVPRYGQRAGNC